VRAGGRRRQVPDRRTDVNTLRARGDVGQEDLGRGDVRVLFQEVMLDRPHVLEVVAVAVNCEIELAHQPIVLGVDRVLVDFVFGDVCLNE
jgi:uncharacterized Fe-S cluster-containing radical SAM superfamily protein